MRVECDKIRLYFHKPGDFLCAFEANRFPLRQIVDYVKKSDKCLVYLRPCISGGDVIYTCPHYRSMSWLMMLYLITIEMALEEFHNYHVTTPHTYWADAAVSGDSHGKCVCGVYVYIWVYRLIRQCMYVCVCVFMYYVPVCLTTETMLTHTSPSFRLFTRIRPQNPNIYEHANCNTGKVSYIYIYVCVCVCAWVRVRSVARVCMYTKK